MGKQTQGHHCLTPSQYIIGAAIAASAHFFQFQLTEILLFKLYLDRFEIYNKFTNLYAPLWSIWPAASEYFRIKTRPRREAIFTYRDGKRMRHPEYSRTGSLSELSVFQASANEGQWRGSWNWARHIASLNQLREIMECAISWICSQGKGKRSN